MARLISERADALAPLAEVFREHGYEGASLALISKATGLGKGSLYHFFPGGKEEMAAAVLEEIEAWFETNIYSPLRSQQDARRATEDMFVAVEDYFRSGRRVCLVGMMALSETRDRFASAVRAFFIAWIDALAAALERGGADAGSARALAEETVGTIQGAIILARALDEPRVFERSIRSMRQRLNDDRG